MNNQTLMQGAMNKKHRNWLKTAEQLFICFLIYSIIGWLYEVFLEVVVYQWGFSNRGVLYGPYCVIYGFGAVVLIICLTKLKQQKIYLGKIPITPFLVFIGIIVIATILELIGSYIMEWRTGSWMWDYTRFAFNFEGRIALNPSLRFGIIGIFCLYVLQPLFMKFLNIWSDKVLHIVSLILALIFLFDAFCTFIL